MVLDSENVFVWILLMATVLPSLLEKVVVDMRPQRADQPDAIKDKEHYYIPVQMNGVLRVPACPVQELSPVRQLVLLSLCPTGTLIILPMVIRAS